MTNSQRLQVELSQKRAVLALYAAGADDGDGGMTAEEARGITAEVGELETRHAAALAAEPDPEPIIEQQEDGAGREIRAMLSEARVARLLRGRGRRARLSTAARPSLRRPTSCAASRAA